METVRITGSAKRHIPGLQAVAKVSGKSGLWLIAHAKRSGYRFSL